MFDTMTKTPDLRPGTLDLLMWERMSQAIGRVLELA
jgi:hypothetical protein